ncbi:MAG: hypothetical protein LBK29_00470 [Oscillospiraceae bacterium]|nr:hypothetical protein [Oscillospiraceae bacterium]
MKNRENLENFMREAEKNYNNAKLQLSDNELKEFVGGSNFVIRATAAAMAFLSFLFSTEVGAKNLETAKQPQVGTVQKIKRIKNKSTVGIKFAAITGIPATLAYFAVKLINSKTIENKRVLLAYLRDKLSDERLKPEIKERFIELEIEITSIINKGDKISKKEIGEYFAKIDQLWLSNLMLGDERPPDIRFSTTHEEEPPREEPPKETDIQNEELKKRVYDSARVYLMFQKKKIELSKSLNALNPFLEKPTYHPYPENLTGVWHEFTERRSLPYVELDALLKRINAGFYNRFYRTIVEIEEPAKKREGFFHVIPEKFEEYWSQDHDFEKLKSDIFRLDYFFSEEKANDFMVAARNAITCLDEATQTSNQKLEEHREKEREEREEREREESKQSVVRAQEAAKIFLAQQRVRREFAVLKNRFLTQNGITLLKADDDPVRMWIEARKDYRGRQQIVFESLIELSGARSLKMFSFNINPEMFENFWNDSSVIEGKKFEEFFFEGSSGKYKKINYEAFMQVSRDLIRTFEESTRELNELLADPLKSKTYFDDLGKQEFENLERLKPMDELTRLLQKSKEITDHSEPFLVQAFREISAVTEASREDVVEWFSEMRNFLVYMNKVIEKHIANPSVETLKDIVVGIDCLAVPRIGILENEIEKVNVEETRLFHYTMEHYRRIYEVLCQNNGKTSVEKTNALRDLINHYRQLTESFRSVKTHPFLKEIAANFSRITEQVKIQLETALREKLEKAKESRQSKIDLIILSTASDERYIPYVLPGEKCEKHFGSGGSVKLFLDRITREKVIIKVGRYGLEPTIRAARILENLDSSYIPKISCTEKGMIMEYVSGAKNMSTYVLSVRSNPKELLRLCREITAGLKEFSRVGIYDMEEKPEHVLVDKHGTVKFIDFDESSYCQSGLTTTAFEKNFLRANSLIDYSVLCCDWSLRSELSEKYLELKRTDTGDCFDILIRAIDELDVYSQAS